MAEKAANDVPTIVKTIEYLRDKQPGRMSSEEVAKSLNENAEEVNKALTELSKRNAIAEEMLGELKLYRFDPNPGAEEFYKKLTDVYGKVERKERSELLLAGLLGDDKIPLYKDALTKALEGDGYKEDEIKDLIARLRTEKKIEVVKRPVFKGKRTKDGKESVTVDALAVYEKEKITGKKLAKKIKKDYKKQGYEGDVYEEEFLVGKFPPKVTDFAKKYIEKEGKSVREKVQKEEPLRYGGKD